MIAQRRVSLVSRCGTVMRLVGDRTTLCIPHCRRLDLRLQHRQVGQVRTKLPASPGRSWPQVRAKSTGPSRGQVQVPCARLSCSLNVIRARCSGSLYFQISADKSGRQAGRQASRAVLSQLAILGYEQSALAILAYFSNPSFRSVTSTAPEQ